MTYNCHFVHVIIKLYNNIMHVFSIIPYTHMCIHNHSQRCCQWWWALVVVVVVVVVEVVVACS